MFIANYLNLTEINQSKMYLNWTMTMNLDLMYSQNNFLLHSFSIITVKALAH